MSPKLKNELNEGKDTETAKNLTMEECWHSLICLRLSTDSQQTRGWIDSVFVGKPKLCRLNW